MLSKFEIWSDDVIRTGRGAEVISLFTFLGITKQETSDKGEIGESEFDFPS